MSKLFIYYSRGGNGDIVSKNLNEFEIRKVEPVKDLPKSFFLSMLSGGFKAGLKLKTKLKDYDKDVSNYSEVLIGSPIWNGNLTPIINKVLSDIDLEDKVVKFVLWSASGEAKGAIKFINKKYPNAKVVVLKEPKKNESELEKLKGLD